MPDAYATVEQAEAYLADAFKRGRPQDVAARKLAKAEKVVAEKIARIARLAAELKTWQRRAVRYAALAARTDAQIAAERQTRKTRAEQRALRSVRRGLRAAPAKEES